MTAYTTLADATLAQDKPLTQSVARALRDNPLSIAEGDASAPKIQPAAMDTDSILVAGSVIIFAEGEDSTNVPEPYIGTTTAIASGVRYTTRVAIFKASGTVTISADFDGSGGDSVDIYIIKNGSISVTKSIDANENFNQTISVSVGDRICMSIPREAPLDYWYIKSNSTDHIGYVI